MGESLRGPSARRKQSAIPRRTTKSLPENPHPAFILTLLQIFIGVDEKSRGTKNITGDAPKPKRFSSLSDNSDDDFQMKFVCHTRCCFTTLVLGQIDQSSCG